MYSGGEIGPNGILILSKIWTWISRSITLQSNRGLDQGILHPWSRFGDPSLNGWWVMVQTREWGEFLKFNLTLKVKVKHPKTIEILSKVFCTQAQGWHTHARTHTHTRADGWRTNGRTDIHKHTNTDAGNNNTQRPKLASGKNYHSLTRINLIHVYWGGSGCTKYKVGTWNNVACRAVTSRAWLSERPELTTKNTQQLCHSHLVSEEQSSNSLMYQQQKCIEYLIQTDLPGSIINWWAAQC